MEEYNNKNWHFPPPSYFPPVILLLMKIDGKICSARIFIDIAVNLMSITGIYLPKDFSIWK